jgi:hypothetical protein
MHLRSPEQIREELDRLQESVQRYRTAIQGNSSLADRVRGKLTVTEERIGEVRSDLLGTASSEILANANSALYQAQLDFKTARDEWSVLR